MSTHPFPIVFLYFLADGNLASDLDIVWLFLPFIIRKKYESEEKADLRALLLG